MGRRKKCEQIKRTNNVMVRFTDAEYASISISAEQAGYPVAVYVRKSALDERIEVHYNITAELPELQKLTAEYSAIGNNLNQIAQCSAFLSYIGSALPSSSTAVFSSRFLPTALSVLLSEAAPRFFRL